MVHTMSFKPGLSLEQKLNTLFPRESSIVLQSLPIQMFNSKCETEGFQSVFKEKISRLLLHPITNTSFVQGRTRHSSPSSKGKGGNT